MEEIRDQMELANEISDVISQPVGFGIDMDEVRTMAHRMATALWGVMSHSSVTSAET